MLLIKFYILEDQLLHSFEEAYKKGDGDLNQLSGLMKWVRDQSAADS